VLIHPSLSLKPLHDFFAFVEGLIAVGFDEPFIEFGERHAFFGGFGGVAGAYVVVGVGFADFAEEFVGFFELPCVP
jgi:hypothetical protein